MQLESCWLLGGNLLTSLSTALGISPYTRCTFLCRSGMGFKHYFAPGSISEHTMYVCDSETGHCILGPFRDVYDAHFSPAGKHILL